VQEEGAVVGRALPDEPTEEVRRDKPVTEAAAQNQANTGGDHVADEATPNSPGGPVSQDVTPAPGSAEKKGPGGDPRLGISMQEKCDRLLSALRDGAKPDGLVPLSISDLSKATGIPCGSVHGVLVKLQNQGHLRRKSGVTRLLHHKPSKAAPEDGEGWTPERETMLSRMWRDGFAADKIASKLGPWCNKNKVIGKARRLGLGEHVNAHNVADRPCGKPPYIQQPPSTVPKQSDAAFDSTAPKPAWPFGKDRLVVQAPAGAPERLAIAGNYLLCGKEKVLLAKEQATVMARLIKDWGSPVHKDDLAQEIMSRSVTGMMSPKVATDELVLKRLVEINTLIKPAGLVVIEDAAKWRLTVRQEAGVPA